MKLPFVSRAHHEDAIRLRDQQIMNLQSELAEAREERKRLMDVIAVKSTGMSIYGIVAPPNEEEEAAERQQSPEKDSAEPVAAKRPEELPPTRARDVVRRAERENLSAAEREQQDYNRLTQAAFEARRELQEAIKRGSATAEQAAGNGNGKSSQ
jgi:hypothetical protein